MTTHHLTAEDITAYLDGESTDVEYRHVSHHLESCADCRKMADDQQFIKNILGSFEEPELPRSFKLPAELGKITPISSPQSPAKAAPTGGSGITRFEPVARLLSIAAVLALLVLGGAQMVGVGDTDTNTNQNNITLDGETNPENSALNEQEPALSRGEVREQGESAAAGLGPVDTTHVLGDTATQAEDTGLTGIEITTIGVGVVALASIASWILIHYRAGESSTQM